MTLCWCQTKKDNVVKEGKKKDLTINGKKTACMVVNKRDRCDLRIREGTYKNLIISVVSLQTTEYVTEKSEVKKE